MKRILLDQNIGLPRHFEALSFLQKMQYMVDVLGYTEQDFHFYNEAYKLFDTLTPKQKQECLAYNQR